MIHRFDVIYIESNNNIQLEAFRSRQVLHLPSAKIPFYETMLANRLQYLHLRILFGI